MQISSVSINLVKSKVNLTDEIVKWALTVGRLLIILTEFVAFSTFIYRFSLDRTLIDIKEKVNQETALISSLKEREDSYRNIHERVALAKGVIASSGSKIKIFQDISEMGSDVTLVNVVIEDETIKIDGKTKSVTSFSRFVETLKEYPKIDSVAIDKIDNKKDVGLLEFGIIGTFKK